MTPASLSKRKPRAWIKALAVTTVASPRALFSRTAAANGVSSPENETQAPSPPPRSLLPLIPLRTLETLAHVVEFLEENHWREEGLYRREGLKLETSELVAFCTDKQQQLPDLALFNPHSITNALKTILADKFEPLIPYAISQQLLDELFDAKATGTSAMNARRFHTILTDKFTHVRAITREFFKIFLLHLNHVSTSIPCRMSAKNLAVAVGILLVRPTEVKKLLSTKDMLKKRQRIAEYLIEHASSLPYDCATELDVQVIPSSAPQNNDEQVPSSELHFVQATWDPSEYAFTLQELHDVFGAFGVVLNLGVNEANDRALVAFQDPESARAAAEAQLPHLHLRQRKQRRPKATAESPKLNAPPYAPVSSGSEASMLIPSPLALKAYQDTDPLADNEHLPSPLNAPTIKRMASELPAPLLLTPSLEQSESVAVVQDSGSPSERFMEARERPPSMVFVQVMQANQASLGSLNGSIQLEDLDSAPTSPTELQQRTLEIPAPSSAKSNDEDDIVAVAARIERQSSSAAVLSSVKVTDNEGDRGSNQEHEPPHGRAQPSSTKAHGRDGSSLANHYSRSYENNDDDSRSLQQNTSNLQLRIIVRSPGTIDSTQTQNKLKPQTLRSTEGLKTAVATVTGDFVVNESPRVKKSGFISDIKRSLRRKKTPLPSELAARAAAVVTSTSGNQKQHEDETPVALSPTRSFSLPTLATANDFDAKIPAFNEHLFSRAKASSEPRGPAIVCQNAATQTLPPRIESAAKATETMVHSPEHRDESESSALLSTLEGKLKNMQMILQTTSGALSSTQKPTEFDRAVFQLHNQLLEMVSEGLSALMSSGKPILNSDDATNATTAVDVNDEFLRFLEIQSRTQVKILEVEVRAGQELIRLHKSQFEKERTEMEQEMAALRMARSEVERMCAELRADLRKCRTELACYVAHATSIKREKTEIQERLAQVETQRQAKELALAKLQSDYEEMRHVAAQAQMRVEKYAVQKDSAQHDRRVNSLLGNKENLYLGRGVSVGKAATSNHQLPETSRFFQEHNRPQETKAMDSVEHDETANQQNQQRSSNVAALEAMKRKMVADIQRQIELTKSALREMEICSSNDDNNASIVEEEEAELRRLQQQLAASTAEIDDAMQESRRKLDSLLGFSDRSSRHWEWDGSEAHGANQDELLSQFSPSELMHDVLTRTHTLATDDASRSNHTQVQQQPDSESSAWSLKSALPRHLTSSRVQHSYSELLPPRREAQSVLYRKWQDDRALKIAQLASARDKQTLRQAQHSMQRFQQTLAAILGGQR